MRNGEKERERGVVRKRERAWSYLRKALSMPIRCCLIIQTTFTVIQTYNKMTWKNVFM